MAGGTFTLPKAYAAASAVVSDGVMVLASPYLLSSATAAFDTLDTGKEIVITGAGASGADLTTKIRRVLSATKVEVADPALTAVGSADLTYVVGVYRLRDLLRKGDTAGNTYDLLYGSRVQLQVNSNSPGKIYVGGPEVSPTNAGIELVAPGSVDNRTQGTDPASTFDDFVCADADSSLLNIHWAER